MYSDELSRLLKELLSNNDLRYRLSRANSLFDAAKISQLAGFDISWQDWMRYQARLAMSLSEEQMSDYCRRISDGIEVFPHATFIPVLGFLCKQGAFEWVLPFDGEADSPLDG